MNWTDGNAETHGPTREIVRLSVNSLSVDSKCASSCQGPEAHLGSVPAAVFHGK